MRGQEFPEPTVDPEEYKMGFFLILAAFAAPLLFLGIDLVRGAPDYFPRSGAVALFLVAFVQQKQLSRLQTKHFRNAERAKNHEQIRGLSGSFQLLEKWTFFSGLYGTTIWAYGDKIVGALLPVAT